ncbi:MAG: esterase [Clostridia bacterium]|nr:esterase [Clostridia bacterium]
MANFQVQYYSSALHRKTTFLAAIPNDIRTDIPRTLNAHQKRPTKALFILHGYTGMMENWVSEELMNHYNVAVFSANAENSFYLDAEATGHQYETMLAIELVDYVRKTFGLAMRPEGTYIAGISMGGFGAVHTGLAHPDRFGKIAGLSSALIVHQIAGMRPGDMSDGVLANYAYYAGCFGDLETVETRDTNPEVLVRKLKEKGEKIPEIYLCCGSEDFLIEPNRAFHRFLTEEGVPHEYHESKGIHDGVFWAEYEPKALAWMFRDEAE